MRKLTQKEIDVLNKLVDDKELMGQGFIKRFIIRNTYEPKHKVGEFVKITCPGCYIWGQPVKNVNGKIVNIEWCIGTANAVSEICVQYEVEVIDQDGREHTEYVEESVHGYFTPRRIEGLSDTDMNYFQKKSEYSQETALEF